MKVDIERLLKRFGIDRNRKKKNSCKQYIGGKYVDICEVLSEENGEVVELLEDEELGRIKEVEEKNREDGSEVLDGVGGQGIEEYLFINSEEERKKGRPSQEIYKEFERIIRLNNSKNTARSYLSAIKYWKEVARKKNKSIYRLTAKDMEQALEKYANRTRIQRMASLRKLAKVYLRSGYTALNSEASMVMISSKKENHIVQYLDGEKFVQVRDMVLEGIDRGEREHLWLGLFLFCGLRIGEVETISLENEKFIKVLGKGDKERLVPCIPLVMDTLKSIKRDGYGGWAKSGKVIDTQLRRKGLLDGFHCHQLRHTFATILYRQGVPLNTIKEILGHNTILTTQVYAKAKVDESVLEKIEVISGKKSKE